MGDKRRSSVMLPLCSQQKSNKYDLQFLFSQLGVIPKSFDWIDFFAVPVESCGAANAETRRQFECHPAVTLQFMCSNVDWSSQVASFMAFSSWRISVLYLQWTIQRKIWGKALHMVRELLRAI